MEKRGLMIGCGMIQIITACQIKHTVLQDMKVDLAYVRIDIDEVTALSIFDRVFKVREEVPPPQKKALKCFINPKYAINEFYSELNPEDYTDIFFWVPNWFFYFLHKYSCVYKHTYRYHVLPEGFGAYEYEKPDIHVKEYGWKPFSKSFCFFDKYLYRYETTINKGIEDTYLINSKYCCSNYDINVVDVPEINKSDIKFVSNINRVVKFIPKRIENKIVFLDNAIEGKRSEMFDTSRVDELICYISKYVGKDRLLLKAKYGVDKTQYSEKVLNSVTFYENTSFAWEWECINDTLKGCVVIGFLSSAIIMPVVLFGFSNPTYVIGKDLVKCCDLITDGFIWSEQTYEKIMLNDQNYSIVSSINEIDAIIDKFLRGDFLDRARI